MRYLLNGCSDFDESIIMNFADSLFRVKQKNYFNLLGRYLFFRTLNFEKINKIHKTTQEAQVSTDRFVYVGIF